MSSLRKFSSLVERITVPKLNLNGCGWRISGGNERVPDCVGVHNC